MTFFASFCFFEQAVSWPHKYGSGYSSRVFFAGFLFYILTAVLSFSKSHLRLILEGGKRQIVNDKKSIFHIPFSSFSPLLPSLSLFNLDHLVINLKNEPLGAAQLSFSCSIILLLFLFYCSIAISFNVSDFRK